MIHDTSEIMDLEQNIIFLSPKSVSSGTYIIKCFTQEGTNQTPLYIQSPKCKSKQGFTKGGKKLFCDLVFTYEDEFFLRWIEQFETFCQKKIFENRSTWFDSDLEMHDIENSFLPSLKTFKSGKQQILRANIPVYLGKCALKIYDEKEEDVNPELIVENSNIMSILEIQGIKCSSRSFQIEYEVKQMLLLNPVDIFEKCVFSVKNKQLLPEEESKDLGKIVVPSLPEPEPEPEKKDLEALVEPEPEPEPEEIKDLDDSVDIEKNTDICEIDLEIPCEPDTEIVQLKKRNDVYYEMYREAKKKAKTARDFALSAYLEAKRIKNTYLFDEAFDSDDDEDIKEMDEMKI